MKTTMTKATNGSSASVVTVDQGGGSFYSYVCVNHGATATAIRAHHKTLKGALRWAKRKLGN